MIYYWRDQNKWSFKKSVFIKTELKVHTKDLNINIELSMVFEPYIFELFRFDRIYRFIYINEHNTFHTQIKPIWLKTHWVHQIHICYHSQFVEESHFILNYYMSDLIVENMGTHTAVKNFIFCQIVWEYKATLLLHSNFLLQNIDFHIIIISLFWNIILLLQLEKSIYYFQK